MATLQERLDLMQGRRQPSELQERLNRMKQGLSPASASKGIAPLMAQKALESPSLPLAVKRSLEPKAAPASKPSNGVGGKAASTTFSPASTYLTGGTSTQATPYGAGLQAQMSKDRGQTATPQVREQETAPDPMIQKNQAVLRQGYQVAKDYQNAQRLAKTYQKQAEEYQRLAQLDIGAAEKRVAELKTAAVDAKAAHTAVDADPKYTYWDGVYESAEAANEAYLADSNAAWAARKKIDDELTALEQDIKNAKSVQFALLPTQDDFEVYAARGAGMKGNPVMPVKRGSDGANAALAAAETLFPRTQGFSPTQSIYDQLTDEEARIYNYLFAKDAERGTDKASEYLAFMRDPMTARRGREYADFVKNSGIFRPGLTLAYGVGSGFDRAMTGIAQNFSDEPIPTSAFQYGAGYTREDLADVGLKFLGHSVGQIGFDVASTAGNMAPAIAVSAATGNPLTGAAVTFASAGGNAYGEALAQGYDQRSARAYGVLAGASEAGLQYVLGGISSLGGKLPNSEMIQSALNNIKNAALRIPAKYAVATAGEMTEEYLQEILTPVFRNLALGENNEFKLFTEDAAYAAILAALSVGVMEGPNIVSTDVNLDRMGQTLRGQWGGDASGVTDVLIRMGLNQEQGSDAYQAAQAAKKQLGKGHALTNVALGSLYQKVMGSFRGEGAATIQSQTHTTTPESTLELQTAGPATMDTTATQNPVEGVKSTPGKVVVKSSGISALEGPESLGKTLASSVDSLKDMDSVAQLTGQEMNDRSKKPSEQIRAFFSKIGSVFRKGFGEVSFGEYGIGGMLNHRPLNRAKMVTLEAVPSVIENGRVISDVADWKGRGYRSVVFGAPVTIGESTVYVAAVVNQNPEGKFYLSECVDSDGNYIRIENNPSDGTKSGVTAQGGITATPEKLSSVDIIPQPPTGVNLQPALPGDIPADIPPGLHGLYRLAQEMSASPPPREIPQRPVQRSAREILAQLAQEKVQDEMQGGPLHGISNEDMKAILDSIAPQGKGASQDIGSAGPGPSVEIGVVDFSDKASIMEQLALAQKETAELDHEVCYCITADGKVWKVSGSASRVNFNGIPSSLVGSYSFHNHPEGKTWYSFSPEDVQSFFEIGEQFAKASDDRYEYTMERTEDTVDIDPEEVYNRFVELLWKDVFRMKWNGEIDPDTDEFHAAMEILSRELKFKYERKKTH